MGFSKWSMMQSQITALTLSSSHAQYVFVAMLLGRKIESLGVGIRLRTSIDKLFFSYVPLITLVRFQWQCLPHVGEL